MCPVPSGFEKQRFFSIFRLMVSFCAFVALWHAEAEEEAELLQEHKNPSHHTQSTMAVSGALYVLL